MKAWVIALFMVFPSLVEARSYTHMWVDQYGVHATAITEDPGMMGGHRQRAMGFLVGPTGMADFTDSGYTVGTAIADTFIPHNNFKILGEYEFSGEIGESHCPYYESTSWPSWFKYKKTLGASVVCIYRDGQPCRTIYAAGIPIGKTCGYWPVPDCWVKCVATHYTIYVAGRGTRPVDIGEYIKPWTMDEDGTVTCHAAVPQILPSNCTECKDTVVYTP